MTNNNNNHGGRRAGAGRKPVGISTKAMSLKLDTTLYEVLSTLENKNRFINEAVKAKLVSEGLIPAE